MHTECDPEWCSNLRLLDTDRLEVGLMIESPGGVIAARAVANSDIELCLITGSDNAAFFSSCVCR